ncbi:MAG TPA: BON domain-containing protein [Pirellulaceae bacterium]|nr:BON domain-containing protein [Pirellulaceae bacterium]
MLKQHPLGGIPVPPNNVDGELTKRVGMYLVSARRELGTLVVNSQDGIVRLTGSVSSFYLRQLAVACAQRVAGVRSVVDELHVDYGGSSRALAPPTQRKIQAAG